MVLGLAFGLFLSIHLAHVNFLTIITWCYVVILEIGGLRIEVFLTKNYILLNMLISNSSCYAVFCVFFFPLVNSSFESKKQNAFGSVVIL